MKTNKPLSSLVAVFALIVLFAPAHALAAAFGVSPPWIENENMKPGSNFVYVINLSTNELPENMTVQSKFEGDPEIAQWLKVKDADNLVMTKGKGITPMSVDVNVPKDAEVGEYTGKLKLSLASESGQTDNVAVLLGGSIEIKLAVVDYDVTDYWVQSISVDPIAVGQPIDLKMSVKNLGNTDLDKVSTNITATNAKTGEKVASGSVENLNTPVYPHTMGNVELTFPAAGLEVGSYWLDLESFKDGKSVYEVRLNLPVEPSTINGSVNTGVEVSKDGRIKPAALEENNQRTNVKTSVRVKAPLTNQLIMVMIGMLVVLIGIVTKIYTILKKKRR